MKTGIYLYSRSGTTWQIADVLRGELEKADQECRIIRLQPARERFILLELMRALRGKGTDIELLPADVNELDQIIIGTPTWGGKPTPAINSFFSQVRNLSRVPRIVLYCTYTMGGDHRVLKKMRSNLPEGNYNLILTKSFCTGKGTDYLEETRGFARDLVKL
ncbi:MAG: NAD(P)H-dependent oxidoreductase [Halanaerobium sp.]|nr:NAD(P)H-dependent oxidoreductase [Halanaerobium sp.]